MLHPLSSSPAAPMAKTQNSADTLSKASLTRIHIYMHDFFFLDTHTQPDTIIAYTKVSVLDGHQIDNPITAEKALLFVLIEFLGEEETCLIINEGFGRLLV